jgi:hypothetical protein
MAERSTSNRDILFTALAGVMGPTSHGSAERILTSHESRSTNLTSHEEEESVDSISSLQIFYSQDRWLREHESLRFISAGSMEICRAKMSLLGGHEERRDSRRQGGWKAGHMWIGMCHWCIPLT